MDFKINSYQDLHRDLTCPFCLTLCVRALTSQCGHVFCASCFVQFINTKDLTEYWDSGVPPPSCPVCRTVLQEVTYSPITDRLIRNLKIICKYCEESISVETFRHDAHICANRTLCENVNCQLPILNENYSLHLRSCPYSLTNCPDCGVEMLNKDSASHRLECSGEIGKT